MNPLTQEAILYTYHYLIRRAGLKIFDPQDTVLKFLGIPIYYAIPENYDSPNPSIYIRPCSDSAYQKLLEKNTKSLSWINIRELLPGGISMPLDGQIPVLFWSEGFEAGHQPCVEQRMDGSVIFYVDILATIFFMLSRWEETVVPIRDHHDRFPATASVAFKQGFLDHPIVDEYALILQAWVKLLIPGWKPKPKEFSVKLSHDIDSVSSTSLYKLADDIFKRHDIPRALKAGRSLLFPYYDPCIQSIYKLAKLSEQYNLDSAFYFMGAKPGLHDDGYDPDNFTVHQCIKELKAKGHEVGFHAGYNTLGDYGRFINEKERLDKVLDEPCRGGRQHYLRFRVPDTWRFWEQAGLTYDSTMSYSDHEGFRCGTCHPFRLFDVEKDREMNLIELPLIIMDGTLRQRVGLSPEETKNRILELARRCKQVNGVFSLLWHNHSLYGEWAPWDEAYKQVLPLLAGMIS